MTELTQGNGGFIRKGAGTSGSYAEFKKRTDVEGATVDFRKTWERAGIAHDGPRIKYAKNFLSKMQKGGRVGPTLIPQMASGGVANMSNATQPNVARMQQAQENFAELLAQSFNTDPVVIYDDEPEAEGGAMVVNGDVNRTVPSLPAGPTTSHAAQYMYKVSLGAVS